MRTAQRLLRFTRLVIVLGTYGFAAWRLWDRYGDVAKGLTRGEFGQASGDDPKEVLQ
jgi:hypothetical protein